MSKLFWWIFGLGAHGVFALTVWFLFWFMKGDLGGHAGGSLWIDVLLALQFGVSHSLLLAPSIKQRLERFIPPPAYGCFFCLMTCGSVLLTCGLWQTSVGALWRLEGSARFAIQTAYFGSWGALLYSLKLTGLGYQTGWTTWWPWVRGLPVPKRAFAPRGAYRMFRHPVYLSFMGLVWFAPDMTYDRAVLVAIWTTYILLGSCLKDRRLIYYLGDRYRAYQADVPGYPGMLVGPLARIPWTQVRNEAETKGQLMLEG